MIDIRTEKLVLLSQAAALLPSRPHRSTLERWRLRGSHGVRLETVLIGGLRYTSEQAIERFVRGVTEASDRHSGIVQSAPHDDRHAAVTAAEKYLATNGI